MSMNVKDLLQDLVRIPSVNPAFLPEGDEPGGEKKIADFLEGFFRSQGWPWLRQEVHPGRDNLVAVVGALPGSGAQDAMLWEVHQDTVGVAGMEIDPFAAEESHGRVWGRGACDIKGGMAAMLSALVRAEKDATAMRQPVVLALSVNEECGFSGVKAFCRLWSGDFAKENVSGPLTVEGLRKLRLTRAVVAEPTLLDVVVAHKGSVRWRCHTHGKAAHSSQPEQGCNAISAMARVVQAIDRYQAEVLNKRPTHALCGGPTTCVGTIEGGAGVNTVPDHAVIDIDRRLVPGELPSEAYAEMKEYVDLHAQGEATIEHEPPTTQSTGLEDDANREWAEQIANTARSLGRSSELVGVRYGTDAWALAELGIPTVVFGPGSIDQAHTVDEWIAVEQLELATEAYFRLATLPS